MKTISDFVKFDSANLAVNCGRNGFDGLETGCEGDVRPDPIGLGVESNGSGFAEPLAAIFWVGWADSPE